MTPRIAIPILFGFLAAGLAAMVTQLDFKFVAALLMLVSGVGVLLLINDSGRIEQLLTAALALAIPVNLDVNFLARPHIGGAPSISISASLLCIATLYLVRFYRYRTRHEAPLLVYDRTLVWASILYMAVGVLSLWNARHSDLVFLEEIRLTTLFLTMLLVMNFRSERLIHLFVTFLVVAASVQGLLSTVQYLGNTSLGLDIFGEAELVELDIGTLVTRATGTIGHPNVLGYYLEIMFPLALALFFFQKSLKMKVISSAAVGLILLGIICTISRGAWVTVPISGLVVFFVMHRRRLLRLGTGVEVSILASLLIVALIFAFPTIKMRLTHEDHQSAASRMPLNYAALSIIRQYPVLGVGLNNFSEVFHEYDTTKLSRRFTMRRVENGVMVERDYKHVVHNMILWVWAEVGTLGLASFLWLFGAAALVARRTWRDADEWSQAVMLGCLTGFMVHFVHGMVDPGFRITPSVSMLIYSMFGIIGALSLRFGRGDLYGWRQSHCL